MQDYRLIEKLSHQNRERFPGRAVHAKGWGAHGTLTITHDITKYTKAKVFSAAGKKTDLLARFSTAAGEMGAADAARDVRGFSPTTPTRMRTTSQIRSAVLSRTAILPSPRSKHRAMRRATTIATAMMITSSRATCSA